MLVKKILNYKILKKDEDQIANRLKKCQQFSDRYGVK